MRVTDGEGSSLKNNIGLSRRLFGGGLATLALSSAASAAAGSTAFPDGATLLVAGPNGGGIDSWAEWIGPTLRHALAPGVVLHKDLVGGFDGVTGANQFEARTVPDGTTALLIPGSAAMAWLIGDPRARFDAATWIPVLAGVTSSVLASRVPLSKINSGAKIRVAALGPAGAQLPAMLVLDLLGANWEPVYGLNAAAAHAALTNGNVDAIYIHGHRVTEAAALTAAAGAPPIFGFGVFDEQGRMQRDPAFPDLPTGDELLAALPPEASLRTACRASAAAAQLDMALVLPQQTPAAMVALWRRACSQAAGAAPVMAQAASLQVRPLPVPAATASTAAVTADATALLDLRHWMATRLDYHAG